MVVLLLSLLVLLWLVGVICVGGIEVVVVVGARSGIDTVVVCGGGGDIAVLVLGVRDAARGVSPSVVAQVRAWRC